MKRTEYQKKMAAQARAILGVVDHFRHNNKNGSIQLVWMRCWYEHEKDETYKRHNRASRKAYRKDQHARKLLSMGIIDQKEYQKRYEEYRKAMYFDLKYEKTPRTLDQNRIDQLIIWCENNAITHRHLVSDDGRKPAITIPPYEWRSIVINNNNQSTTE